MVYFHSPVLEQDLRIAAISVGAIRESPLHLGLDFLCVSQG